MQSNKCFMLTCFMLVVSISYAEPRIAVNLPVLKHEQEQQIKKLAGVNNLDELSAAQEKCVRELFYTVSEKAVLELAGVKSESELSKEQKEAYRKLNEATGVTDLRPEWTEKLNELIGDKLLAPVSQPRRLLVFYRTDGFSHRHAIIAGNEAIRIAAEKTRAFRVDFSDEYMALQPHNLAHYDAIVLNNTTNLKSDHYRFVASALIDFVKYGKGMAVIHSGNDGFNEAPELLYMIGGRFCGHPWGSGGTWRFKVEDSESPLTSMFNKEGFSFSDEIYMQAAPYYSRQALHVLISLDLSDPATKEALDKSDIRRRPDNDYAVAWVRKFGRGRLFYSSFGHDHRAWLDKSVLMHLLGGIQYALNDVKSNETPSMPQFVDPPKK